MPSASFNASMAHHNDEGRVRNEKGPETKRIELLHGFDDTHCQDIPRRKERICLQAGRISPGLSPKDSASDAVGLMRWPESTWPLLCCCPPGFANAWSLADL